MKVAVIGSRDYPLLDLVRRLVLDLPPDTVVVSGGARGVDRTAEETARARGLEVIVLEPDWEEGRHAGLARNEDIVEAAEEVIAFWDGESRGTAHAVRRALEAGKTVRVLGPRGEAVEPAACARSGRRRRWGA